MTLETAKRILEELPQDKSVYFKYRMKNYAIIHEAEAVCRGGFTFCEHEENGGRVYLFLKVKPTLTDDESSINVSLEEYRRKKNNRPNNKENEVGYISKENENIPKPPVTNISKETNVQTILPSFLERIKIKIKKIWNEIDSIVME